MDRRKIPSFVVGWTDAYFHRSAYDLPLNPPSRRIIKFLQQFSKPERVTLFRGVHEYNKDNLTITSWTYDKKVAQRYISESKHGEILEVEFTSEKILLDTTFLNKDEKLFLGYDYIIDDKEVLIINI